MKNNLKEKVSLNTNNTEYNESNQRYQKINSENEYFISSSEISNQGKIPPKNSISELVFTNNIAELKKKLNKSTVNLDLRDDSGQTASWTPLYWGVKYRRVECVKLLLASGANINTVINDLEECCGTVLDLAILRGDLEIENLLREFSNREETNINVTFKAIRTKLRGKAPSFNFNSYTGKTKN